MEEPPHLLLTQNGGAVNKNNLNKWIGWKK
jgi:hypothetical protein